MAIAALEPPKDDPSKKRGPGRPKGSKNKPKNPVDDFVKQTQGNGDAPPGEGKRTRKKRISKKVTEDIESALAEVLCAPAMVAAFQEDEWAANHFVVTGKELAHRIAIVSERNSQLRMWCERLLVGESSAVLALGVLAYLVPPLIHYNLIPGPDGMLGVPRRPKGKRKRQRTTGTPGDGTEWAEGLTEQQRYEAQMRANAAQAAAEAEIEDIEFSGEDDPNEPPTFTSDI